jgi:diguanylate cyclase (GGDEF)-like protein/PAS domain S-box-containing protein
MPRVAEPPVLTTRSVAVGRFARRWADALAGGGRISGTVTEITQELRPLTVRLARAVRDGTVTDALGADIGSSLLQLGFGSTAVIAPTLSVVLDGFAADLTPALGLPTELTSSRVVGLAATLAEGCAHALREHALAAQEELQRAALTAVRTAEVERRSSEARFRALFAQAAVGIGLISTEGRVIDANAAWAAMMGFSVAEMRGLPINEVVMPGGSLPAMELLLELLSGRRDAFRMEIAHENRLQEKLFLDLSVSRVSGVDGDTDFLVGVAVDVTERRLLQDRLWHEARHDPLTGLPNRTLFFERLEQLLSSGPVGVCYLDLDGFKSVNDGLGHEVGDRLLVLVAQRLAATVPDSSGLLARLGGDEFGVLVDGSDPAVAASRVLTALSTPFLLDGRDLTVSASVGVVDTATAGTAADGLMRAADITLYQAKARGRGRWEQYDPHLDAHQVTRHALATEMSSALARGEFFLEYQPLVSLRDGRIRQVEALLRWRHPTLGLLYPDRFVGMAEENGFIVALGRWVLETAVAAAHQWYQRFPLARIGLNVNVSVSQLYDPGLPDHVLSALATTGLPPSLLHLELTESAVLGSASGPVEALTGLAAEGVHLVIDDFGTGYSNLVHLSRLPAGELKLAGSFLTAAPGTDGTNDKIVAAVVSLAHSLGLSVTVEGVENAGQAARLRELQCDTAQGWFFGLPTSPDAIEALLAAGA